MATMQPGPGNHPAPRQTSGLAVAALVLGIVSLVLFCVPYISMPSAILAVVLGAIARGKPAGRGMATAGMVCGLIAIGIVFLVLVGCLTALGVGSTGMVELLEQEMSRASNEMQRTLAATQPTTMPDPNAP